QHHVPHRALARLPAAQARRGQEPGPHEGRGREAAEHDRRQPRRRRRQEERARRHRLEPRRMSESPLRLARLGLPARLLVTLFVVCIGAGYFSALLQLHTVHGSREDVVAAFHGSPDRTRLVVMAEGDMRQHLKTDAELEAIRRWVAAGTPRESWEPVHEILSARCVRCHSEGKEKEDAPLVSYEDVTRETRIEPLIATRRLIA